MVTLFMLCLPPLGLTVAMFATRNMMLGFPCAIFWGIFGGYSYLQSTETWDWQYILFFASMGMVIFSLSTMYALRKKDLAGPDADKGKFIDEGGTARRKPIEAKPVPKKGVLLEKVEWGDIDHLGMYDLADRRPDDVAVVEKPPASSPRERIQARAKRRKAEIAWGEFK